MVLQLKNTKYWVLEIKTVHLDLDMVVLINFDFRMFQTNPETIQYFPQFSELDNPDKQKNSEVFKDHAEKVKF